LPEAGAKPLTVSFASSRSERGAIGLAVCGFTFWVLADTVINISDRTTTRSAFTS
jgi:hypothetical protein